MRQQLKTLAVVLKNLIDPSKGAAPGDAGIKYRTLKLDNPKLADRLFCSASVRDLLEDERVGMVEASRTLVLEEAPCPSARETMAREVLPAIARAQSALQPRASVHKKARTDADRPAAALPVQQPLSEKQKARLLLEEKKRLEKERDRLHKQTVRAQIAADKRVRLHDENWKPAVSAAADKTGNGLQSFRDRHGEQ